MAASFVVNCTLAQLLELTDWKDRFAVAVRAGEVSAMVRSIGQFYSVLTRGASSRVLERQLDALYLRTTALRMTSLAQPGRADLSLAEVEELFDALQHREAEAARAAAMRHVLNVGSVGLEALNTQDAWIISSFEATARALLGEG